MIFGKCHVSVVQIGLPGGRSLACLGWLAWGRSLACLGRPLLACQQQAFNVFKAHLQPVCSFALLNSMPEKCVSVPWHVASDADCNFTTRVPGKCGN